MAIRPGRRCPHDGASSTSTPCAVSSCGKALGIPLDHRANPPAASSPVHLRPDDRAFRSETGQWDVHRLGARPDWPSTSSAVDTSAKVAVVSSWAATAPRAQPPPRQVTETARPPGVLACQAPTARLRPRERSRTPRRCRSALAAGRRPAVPGCPRCAEPTDVSRSGRPPAGGSPLWPAAPRLRRGRARRATGPAASCPVGRLTDGVELPAVALPVQLDHHQPGVGAAAAQFVPRQLRTIRLVDQSAEGVGHLVERLTLERTHREDERGHVNG